MPKSNNKEEFEEYKQVLEHLMDIVLMIGEDGGILYANQKAIETYGYSYDEITKLNIFHMRKECIVDYTKMQLNEALMKGVKFKTVHYKKDGSCFPVEVHSIYSNKDNKKSVISIIRDISDFDEIARYSNMFTVSLNIFDDAIVLISNDLKVKLWNKGATKRLGYLNKEIIEKDIKILIPNDKLNEFNEHIKIVSKGEIVESYETVRIHKNGDLIDVSVSLSPLYDYDGNMTGILGIYKDISDKKELAKQLAENEERWRYALNGSQFGVWDWNIITDNMYNSSSFLSILGYNDGEVLNMYTEWIIRIHPEDIDYYNKIMANHLERGKDFDVEIRIKCQNQNSQYKWIRSKGKVSERDKDGNPIRMVGTHEDISQRKYIEHELKDKYHQLQLMKDKAEEASREKSMFLANMSHEIRTPLHGVNSIVQLLELTDANSEQSKYINLLKESSNQLEAVINDILDMSRIESGKLQLKEENFNLKEITMAIYNSLLVMGNSKGLETGYYFDQNIFPQVIGDVLKLKQILINLINNSLKFTDDGYISFRTILKSKRDNYQKIQFIIKDSGIGIPDDFKEKIFHNFSQGDISSKKQYRGTGLGLSISKKLADIMNGELSYDSHINEGSTFFLTCEFKKAEKYNYELSNNKINTKCNYKNLNKTILYVEDNIINHEVMDNIITKEGYRYLWAHNGEEALEILKNYKVDLILMDIQLPQTNGFEVTKTIREEIIAGKDIPIIAITAYGLREDKNKCLEAGMNDYITKPFNIEKLYEVIQKHLQ